MPRYVILEHDHPFLHWDLMLEAGDVLHTWRLAQTPAVNSSIEATALPDHRRLYLDYEGPVSGNRGAVTRWDAGTFEEDADSRADARRLRFEGTRIRGQIWLEHDREERWLFRWTY